MAEELPGFFRHPNRQSSIVSPYLFTGREYDPETGWYSYRTRYLDPVAGRFTTRDTIGIWGDTANLGNGYTYARNNPWTFLDPRGEDSDVPVGSDVTVIVGSSGGSTTIVGSSGKRSCTVGSSGSTTAPRKEAPSAPNKENRGQSDSTRLYESTVIGPTARADLVIGPVKTLPSGSLWQWGQSGKYGQLGLGGRLDPFYPRKQPEPKELPSSQKSSPKDTLWRWGQSSGQLGLGDQPSNKHPELEGEAFKAFKK